MKMDPARNMSGVEWGLLFLLSVIWGGSFYFAKAALSDFGPFTIVLGRVVVGSLTLFLIARTMRIAMPRDAKSWRDFATMGILNNVIPFSLIFWGQTEIASGLAATLNATTPLFAIAVGRMLDAKARIRANQLGGILLGVLGVAFLIGPAAFRDLRHGIAGEIAVLGAAFSYALAGHFGRRFRSLAPIIPASGQVTCSAIIMLPVALLIETPWRQPVPGPIAWAYILALGILCTAIAYLIFFRILATAGAVNLMLVTILVPASAIVLGFLFLNERLSWVDFIGMASIAAGLLAIDGRAFARLSRAWPSGAR
jgi:drug/metabolite transporter (DMT)-like permease